MPGPTGRGTISGRQFLWGVGLPKGNGGVQRFPRARRRLALECKGRRELDCKTHPSSRDDASHLFFSCSKIMLLWWESLSWTNTLEPFPENPRMHFLQHVVGNGNGNSFQNWKCWWMSLTWSIWQHRNKIVFEEERFNDSKLLEDAIFLCWTWLKNLVKGFDMPFYHWSSNMKEVFMG